MTDGAPHLRAPLRPRRMRLAGAGASVAAGTSLAVLGFAPWALAGAAAAATLIWIAAIDLETRLIPNRIVLPATAALVAAAVAIDPAFGLERALAAGIAALCLLVPVLVYPAGLGMGDVKLAAMLGALLGAAAFAAVVAGFVLAGLVGAVLVAVRGRAALKASLPLAPFLAAGALAVLLVPA